MRISFTRGNVSHLLLSGFIYILAVFILPLQLPRNISVDNRVSIVLFLSITATVILSVLAIKNKNDIDRQKSTYNLITIIAIGIIGFVSMMLLQGFINGLLVYLSNFFNFETKSRNTSNVVEIIKIKPYFVLYVAVLGPIMEELFFRKAVFGYFYDAMIGSKDWIRFTIPALITGIIFALPHDGISPIMVIYIGMSFVFSYLYTHTRSILTPIISHILMNSLVVLVQVYFA
ncbi:CPBP family intramembrane glutamic endopeptidase [Gemella haemolysans]|jgi:metal-dependent membrane protease|uniref:CAAX amino terminal protease family protein n=1 Tax=Gemella haemolysans TaxID=1379 RepID=A0A133ZQ55_9BACL|nr:CPBP family intramembrane glutamic endopeptidase [Gemella haemolysans]KXB57556.1 CAAX amino terminal protease family protein [Gemella haemolysans]MDU3832215.1 CPBP family intramembrane glutamic endopeptidase [Gemella haemolysans]MDU6767387.1 CPBP family intramembrane glutamic endopeptidase [Gemella haemolysans]